MTRRRRPRLYRWKHRQAVVAALWEDGRRIFRRLCSFAEAQIAPDGSDLPAWPVERREAFLRALLTGALDGHAARTAERRVEAAQRGPPLREAWQAWLDHAGTTRALGTVVNYAGTGRRAVLFWGAQRRIGTIGVREIQAFDKHLAGPRGPKPGLSLFGRNGHLNALKAFFRWAAERGDLEAVPRIRVHRLPHVLPRPADPRDVQKMLDWLAPQRSLTGRAGRDSRHLYRAILMARATLMRVGEIAALPLACIDLDAGLIAVRRPKERRDKIIPCVRWFHAWLRRELAAPTPGERYYLDCGGRPVGKDRLVRLAQRARSFAGVPGFRFHRVRSLGITELLARHVDLHAVSELAGHASVLTTARAYAGLLPERKAAAIALIRAPVFPRRVSARRK